MDDKFCIQCKHFRDGNFNQYTYIAPECTQRGQDSAAFMREWICGLDGTLYEPKQLTDPIGSQQHGKTNSIQE